MPAKVHLEVFVQCELFCCEKEGKGDEKKNIPLSPSIDFASRQLVAPIDI